MLRECSTCEDDDDDDVCVCAISMLRVFIRLGFWNLYIFDLFKHDRYE